MGLLDRLRRRPPVEQRLGSWGAVSLGLTGGLHARTPLPAHLAESLSAVTGCVELIAGALASLPASLVQDGPNGRTPAPASAPAWRILNRPNRWMSWPSFMSWVASQVLLYGNAVCRVETDARGAVSGLSPAPWPWLLPAFINAGPTGAARLVFDVMQSYPEAALLGLPPRLLAEDTLHIKARSDFGVLGPVTS